MFAPLPNAGVCLLAVLLPVLMLQSGPAAHRLWRATAAGSLHAAHHRLRPVGGLLPGLLCTLVTALVTSYFMLPRSLSCRRAGQDLVQWCLLIANGLLISLLSAAIHQRPGQEVLRWQELMNTSPSLQQSENRFQVTFEQAAVGIALVSPMDTGCVSISGCATSWATGPTSSPG